MRNTTINFSEIFEIAAEASRNIVATVDVIRNGASACLRLYAHAWQHAEYSASKQMQNVSEQLSWLGSRLPEYLFPEGRLSFTGFDTGSGKAGYESLAGSMPCWSQRRCTASLAWIGRS
ncbi:MAG: hypothetical protein COA78_07275 [Blastopirellula sp.]|nr:MAG: hypothetical protein COA78_07275 [Blastopirellula sp.]